MSQRTAGQTQFSPGVNGSNIPPALQRLCFKGTEVHTCCLQMQRLGAIHICIKRL